MEVYPCGFLGERTGISRGSIPVRCLERIGVWFRNSGGISGRRAGEVSVGVLGKGDLGSFGGGQEGRTGVSTTPWWCRCPGVSLMWWEKGHGTVVPGVTEGLQETVVGSGLREQVGPNQTHSSVPFPDFQGVGDPQTRESTGPGRGAPGRAWVPSGSGVHPGEWYRGNRGAPGPPGS